MIATQKFKVLESEISITIKSYALHDSYSKPPQQKVCYYELLFAMTARLLSAGLSDNEILIEDTPSIPLIQMCNYIGDDEEEHSFSEEEMGCRPISPVMLPLLEE